MPRTLVQKFGVAALRGVARNKSIAEFQLVPIIHDSQVVDGMLAQLTPDERRKFRVKAEFFPSIELCSVGEWSMSVSQAAIPTPVQHPMYMYQPLHCCRNGAVQSVEVQ